MELKMARKRILIVHDDPDMVTVLRLILESDGYEVLDASSSQEGLQKIQELFPNLIILDAPLEMASDPQISLTLRNPASQSPYAAYRHVPILVLTPHHTTTSLRLGPDEAYLPVDDFVDMPIDPDLLLNKVRAFMA